MKKQIILSGVVGILALSTVGRAADVDLTLVRRDLLPEDNAYAVLLPDEPIDFFTGKPVLYSKEKGLLWSVGPDGKDDGGDTKKDFVIKLPSHALKQFRKETGLGLKDAKEFLDAINVES